MRGRGSSPGLGSRSLQGSDPWPLQCERKPGPPNRNAWSSRSAIRAKLRSGTFGRSACGSLCSARLWLRGPFSVWFRDWRGSPLRTISLFAPDVGLALIATAGRLGRPEAVSDLRARLDRRAPGPRPGHVAPKTTPNDRAQIHSESSTGRGHSGRLIGIRAGDRAETAAWQGLCGRNTRPSQRRLPAHRRRVWPSFHRRTNQRLGLRNSCARIGMNSLGVDGGTRRPHVRLRRKWKASDRCQLQIQSARRPSQRLNDAHW
jgi:hypothetical protein